MHPRSWLALLTLPLVGVFTYPVLFRAQAPQSKTQSAPDPAADLAKALLADRGRILSALIARVRDFQLAEDALQDAAASALIHWARSGTPDNPMAWLIRVAFRKAIDRLRHAARDQRQAGPTGGFELGS